MPQRNASASAVLGRVRARRRKLRFATSLAFATLFSGGAALSAGAGETLVPATDAQTPTEVAPAVAIPPPEDEPAAVEEPATIPPGEDVPEQRSDQPAAEEPVADAPAPVAPTGTDASARPGGPAPRTSELPAAPASGGAPASGERGPRPSDANEGRPPVSAPPLLQSRDRGRREATRELDAEAHAFDGFATIWLHRTLPDPTPPAKRLAPAFARMLRAEAARAGVDWAALLGALRAEGKAGRFPAGRAYVRSLASRLAGYADGGEWQAFLALRGRTIYADRAQALARYNRAIGLRALVTGLDAAKPRLEDAVLADARLDVYGGGRADIAAGRIDVRVLVLLRYLAEAHGRVTVSSLDSGHGLYARPGVVSAHAYGLAVDIAALAGRPIAGNSAPGGLTERAVRNILLLPAEVRPRQVISLLGLGGPSFPLANHADHIHAGF